MPFSERFILILFLTFIFLDYCLAALSVKVQSCQITPSQSPMKKPVQCPPLAHNVVAAWRQAGASVKFGREQKMMLPALCQTSMHPRLRQTDR